ncbi:MAG: hypothetical protein PHX61_03560 [Alphaproteobacteria bacterium]|nr:hypothetical protein [Alphaproteobacteria bacterium]
MMKYQIFLAMTLIALFTPSAFAAISVPFTVAMSEAVNVTGCPANCPRIAVTVDGQTRYADYTSGSGTSALTFTYAPTIGDLDLDGVTLTSPIDLNGGTITDLNGNAVTPLTFTVPDTSGIKIDYPSLSMDFVADADGRYTLNGTTYNDLSSFLGAAGGSYTRSSTGTYFDASGVLQTAAANQPRFDHNPATLQPKGIIIEESRTNYIRNNTMQGAIVGTPGTLPTGWSVSLAAGISYEVSGIGQEDGIDYIDIRLYGTPSTTNAATIIFSPTMDTSASPNEIFTHSSYFKRQAGTATNIPYVVNRIGNYNSGGFSIGQLASSAPVPSTLPLRRTSIGVTSSAATFSSASTAYVRPFIVVPVSAAGVPIDITFRIGTPQLERGGNRTSRILTSGSAVTRDADAITIPVGGWFLASAQTLAGQYSSGAPSGYSTRLASLNDGTSNNAYQIANAASGTIFSQKAVSGVISNSSGPAYVSGASYKVASSMDASSSPFAANNTLYNNSNGGIPSGLTRLQVGYQSNSSFLNGNIENLKYYPSRVSDTQLQLLTQ